MFYVTIQDEKATRHGFRRFNHAMARANYVWKNAGRKADICNDQDDIYVFSTYVGHITNHPIVCSFRPSFFNPQILRLEIKMPS